MLSACPYTFGDLSNSPGTDILTFCVSKEWFSKICTCQDLKSNKKQPKGGFHKSCHKLSLCPKTYLCSKMFLNRRKTHKTGKCVLLYKTF